MSSVASKQALLIALGGISIAAIFVWYIKKDGGKKKKSTLTDSNGSASVQNGSVGNKKQQQNGHANGSISSSKPKVAEVPNPAEEAPAQNEKPIEVVVEKKQNEPENKSESVETDHAAAGDYSEAVQQAEDVEVQEEEQKESEPEQKPEEKVEPVKEEVEEEQFVKKEEPKLKSAPPAAPLIMPLPKTKVLENEQIPEEPTPTKCFGNLTVDTVSPASAFSWSEEMEKSYNEEEFRAQESSDIDRSPASPLRHTSHHQNHHHKKNGGSMQKNMSNNKKGARGTPNHNQHYQPPQPEKRGDVKKGQRRLTKEKSAEEKVEKPQKRVVIKETPVVQTMPAETTELPQSPIHSDESYEKSGSPGLDSQNSEASSQDSGRATGPLASPHDGDINGTEEDYLPMYEFEIPNSLVGLIIGVKGKTIKELSQRTNVRMLIRQHHAPEKSKSHQICQVRGKRDEINHCLQMLRRRFPPARFPELNLQPVVPPILPNGNFDMLSTTPTWLTLPDDIKCEVAVSSIINVSHFFIQQPTHPSFASLRHLDMYMASLYGEQSNLPELPIPCQKGLLCAASIGNSWFRAVTVHYYDETDEVYVKFVDYGGYSRMARQDLRQIRTDLMSLPFQATEVVLAHVRPVDGTTNWSEGAMQLFKEACTGKAINCKVVGHSVETDMAMVELYVPVKMGNETKEVRFDNLLMERGFARTADPSKMVRVSYQPNLLAGDVQMKRPSFSSQTSQTAVVC